MTITNTDLNELLDADPRRRGHRRRAPGRRADAPGPDRRRGDRPDRRRALRAHRAPGPPSATAPATGCSRPRPVTWTSRSPSSARAASSRRILERRRRIDRALFAVVMEAYVHGVSTRKVDDLVAALGLESGISKSEVSRICAELDERARGLPGPLASPTSSSPTCSWTPPT